MLELEIVVLEGRFSGKSELSWNASEPVTQMPSVFAQLPAKKTSYGDLARYPDCKLIVEFEHLDIVERGWTTRRKNRNRTFRGGLYAPGLQGANLGCAPVMEKGIFVPASRLRQKTNVVCATWYNTLNHSPRPATVRETLLFSAVSKPKSATNGLLKNARRGRHITLSDLRLF